MKLLNHPHWPAMAAQSAAAPTMVAALMQFGEQLISQDDKALKALGFWLRPANIKRLAARYQGRRALGTVLHLAPGNVDTVFLYPLTLSLLAGNANAVRLSERTLPAMAPLLALLDKPELAPINKQLALFSCPHHSEALAALSQDAALRLCWGSDQSIRNIRQHLPAKGLDLAFGHKHSLCLIAAGSVSEDTLDTLVERFIRDTFDYDQQACSSPRTLIWLGSAAAVAQAQALFWPALASRAPQPEAASSLARLESLQSMAVLGLAPQQAHWQTGFARLAVARLDAAQEAAHQGHGLFFELAVEQLDSLAGQLLPWHQTLVYWGLDKASLAPLASHGLDRIEPLGQALAFSEVWDSLDLPMLMSRPCLA